MDSESANNYASCQSHCCFWDGCKYGFKHCPVEAGTVKQDYPCEYCPTKSDIEKAKEVLEQAEWLEKCGFKIHYW